MTSYYESAKGATITKQRAIQEYQAHGFTSADLIAGLGDHSTYRAQQVLLMLGY